jgi:hypothetical protein
VAVAGARPDAEGIPLTRAGRCRGWRAIWPGRESASRPPIWAGSCAGPGSPSERTRSWKASPDPDYEAKAARCLALYRTPPHDGVLISFDEMGPISLRPHQPLLPLDAGDPRLGGRAQRGARAHATYASYLNRIECHFFPIAESVVRNAMELSRSERRRAWRSAISAAIMRNRGSATTTAR